MMEWSSLSRMCVWVSQLDASGLTANPQALLSHLSPEGKGHLPLGNSEK